LNPALEPLSLLMFQGTVSLVLHYLGLTRSLFFIDGLACGPDIEEEISI
jgi:hypothetical protein